MSSRRHKVVSIRCWQWLPLLLWILSSNQFISQVGAQGGEKAAHPTPTLDVNYTSVRQSVCHRYLDSSELRRALSGMSLNPILSVSQFFRYTEADGIDPDDPGLMASILDQLATRANFTWRNSFAVSYGPEANQTYTQLLEQYVELFDIVVDYWDKSSERLNKGIAFLDRWFDGNIILVQKVIPPDNSKKVNYLNFLRPFTPNVWYVTLVTVVVSAMIYQWLEYMHQERDDRTLWQWFQDNLYLSSMNFTQQYAYEPASPAARIFGLSMAATYTANLASLFVEDLGAPTKISDIDEAIRLQKKLCTWAGTNADQYIRKRYPQAKRVPMATELEAYQALQTGECDLTIGAAASWSAYENQAAYNPFCDLEWVGRTIEEVSSAFTVKADPALKCTNLIRDVLNYHLNEMNTDGTMEALWDNYYASEATQNCDLIKGNTGDDDDDIDADRDQRRLQQQIQQQQSDASFSYLKRPFGGRYLKSGGGGGGGGTANAAAAAAGDDEESSSLAMDAMAGTFVLHAALTCVAIVVAFITTGHKKSKDKLNCKSRKSLPSPDMTTEMTEHSHVSVATRLASGTASLSTQGQVDSLTVTRHATIQEQLEALCANQVHMQQANNTLQQQQEELAQQMALVVSMLSKLQQSQSQPPSQTQAQQQSQTTQAGDHQERTELSSLSSSEAPTGRRFAHFFS